MARAAAKAAALRAVALDLWRGVRHQSETVPEWDGAKVQVRGMLAADWTAYNSLALAMAPRPADESGHAPEPVKGAEHGNRLLFALVLARTLHDDDRQRLFTDEDAPEIAAAYSPVHDRLVALAFELSGASLSAGDPVEAAGNE